MQLPPSECAFRRSLRAGFTLLELSIVLVIIGLLIGGIFVGQSLIHNAQLNAVITEFNRYRTAVNAFQQQYQALPGDMNNATSFWGVAGGTGSDATCQNTVSTTTATCNGNGDGVILTSVVSSDESYRAWQHLANAKMVEGFYAGPGGALPGVNVPASRYGSNVGWYFQPGPWLFGSGGSATLFNTDYGTGNDLQFGTPSGTGMTPKDAWSIDKKIDDGRPALGNVIVFNWSACTNAANKSDLTATYTLTTTSAGCGLIFFTNF